MREMLPLPTAFLARCQAIVGARYVLQQPQELATYACDACTLVEAPPQLVILPKTPDEAAAVVRACLAYNIPYVARGSGTGLSGGALTITGGVIIGLNRLTQVVQVDVPNRFAQVECGVINGHLNVQLAPLGLFFAPDPSSQSACTLGGNIAENAGGIHCIGYGVTADHILALEWIDPVRGERHWVGNTVGSVLGNDATPSAVPWQASPDWKSLLLGAEGTLGIVTQAIVKLLPLPEQVYTVLVAFATVQQATQAVEAIMASGLTPAALEFMDAFTIAVVNEAFHVGFPYGCEAVLLIELDSNLGAMATQQAQLAGVLAHFSPLLQREATTAEARQALWQARKGAVAAYGRRYPAFYLHDVVIPRSQLAHVLAEILAIAKAHDVVVGNVFHAGDGNLHPHLFFTPGDTAQFDRVMAAGEAIAQAALNAGGALSGEHGIGIEKLHLMPQLFSAESLAWMYDLQQAVDPRRLANPAKLIPTPRGCGETHSASRVWSAEHPLFTEKGVWV